MLEDLPVLARLEVAVSLWMFGVYHLTIIGKLRPLSVVGRGICYFGLNIYQPADDLADSLIKVNQKLVSLLEEGADIISVVFEEGTLAVG